MILNKHCQCQMSDNFDEVKEEGSLESNYMKGLNMIHLQDLTA